MNCWNGEKYLRQAIESVLVQTYENWEIIFWNNRSTDHSAEVFNSYSDARLKYFDAPKHAGLYEARNYAVEKASGDFLAFLDVDDWWMPTKLEKQIPLFSDPEVGLVCGNYWVVNEKKNRRWIRYEQTIPTGWVLNDLLTSYFAGLLTLVIRKSAFEALSYPCDPRFGMIGDLDLVVRLSMHSRLECVQEPVAFYRKHDGNETAKHLHRHVDELECWMAEMSEFEVIRSCTGWKSALNNLTYLKALVQVLQGNKKAGYDLFQNLPWCRLKVRLLLILLLPTLIAQRLKK